MGLSRFGGWDQAGDPAGPAGKFLLKEAGRAQAFQALVYHRPVGAAISCGGRADAELFRRRHRQRDRTRRRLLRRLHSDDGSRRHGLLRQLRPRRRRLRRGNPRRHRRRNRRRGRTHRRRLLAVRGRELRRHHRRTADHGGSTPRRASAGARTRRGHRQPANRTDQGNKQRQRFLAHTRASGPLPCRARSCRMEGDRSEGSRRRMGRGGRSSGRPDTRGVRSGEEQVAEAAQLTNARRNLQTA